MVSLSVGNPAVTKDLSSVAALQSLEMVVGFPVRWRCLPSVLGCQLSLLPTDQISVNSLPSAILMIVAGYGLAAEDGFENRLTEALRAKGHDVRIVDGAVSGNVVKLKLAATAAAKTITYLVDRKWDPKNLLYGTNGIAALTFFEAAIEASAR